MTAIEVPESGGALHGGAGITVGLRLRRRDTVEALGLLLGIFGVLLAIAVTLGAPPPG
jgi:hypothetical protein